jgi:hypothetical protein
MVIAVVTTSISETWHYRERFLFHYGKHEVEIQMEQLHTHICVSAIWLSSELCHHIVE